MASETRKLTPVGAYRISWKLAQAGRFVEANPYLAYSAEAGYAHAIYGLATWYLHGRHVRKNYQAGARLLKRAAALGHRTAKYDLAVSYETGKGAKRDPRKAFSLYKAAADAGDVDASLEVGRMYY